MLFSLCGCKKKKKKEEQYIPNPVVQATPSIFEVDINLNNIYDYFEFKQYPTYYKDDNGNTTSVQISYGLALKTGYYAVNSPKYKDTMTLKFTADGVVHKGVFDVDYETLQYSGNIEETSYTTVSESLKFWPQGDRTTTWAFGNFSSSYIIYFQNFYVTEVKGKIHITTVPHE